MNSVLDGIDNWCERAQAARYDPNELARGLRVSVRHLERFFRARFGLTPQNIQRLRRALPLLKTSQNIKEIANELGFKQASHFSRCFKAVHGLAPSRLRARTNGLLRTRNVAVASNELN